MRTVGITVEETSFAELDAVSRAAGLTPAEFVRRAAAAAVRSWKARDAARRDADGYVNAPATDEEFAVNVEDLERADDAAW